MPKQRLTLEEARERAEVSIFRRAGGYCAMEHPTEPGSCTLSPLHESHHRDWYRRDTPLGPYLDWTNDDYAR
jgi:hypothetical protein